jgi:DNA-binding IclR family transcriptional regulator
VKSESAHAGAHAHAATSSRSLSTARAALRVLSMLAEQPSGVRADEVAHALGKSTSTAYYLLTSLCEEGFAVHESKGLYRPARGLEQLTLAAEQAGPVRGNLKGTVDKLFLRTRRRSYLGALRDGRIEIVAFRGRQGVPRMPGLGTEIRDSAHALAMGKVVLALLGTRGVSRYIARGLKPFTPHTITSADVLLEDLERVRRRGFAVDREEFDENFCCVAAPIFDDSGRFLAALGMSMTRHVFDTELDPLAAAVVDVANLQTDAKNRRFLSPVTLAPTLSSAAEAVAGP